MNVIMKMIFSIVCLCALCVFAADVSADTVPKRKFGLWEIKVHMEGIPDMGPTQECVDQNTDSLVQQGSQGEESACKNPVVKQSGDKISIHSECKISDSMTVIMDYLLQGSLDSAYKGTVTTQTKSAKGTSSSTITLDAKWIGSCKP